MNILTSQKKTKKTRKYTKYYKFFVLTKRIRKKKRLIKDKVQIENNDLRIIKWLQQFHNKSYTISC